MSYGLAQLAQTQTAAGYSGAGVMPPPPRESLSIVLQQALEQYSNAEGRLRTLRDRVEPVPLAAEKSVVEPAVKGTLHLAFELRSLSQRIQERVTELENLI